MKLGSNSSIDGRTKGNGGERTGKDFNKTYYMHGGSYYPRNTQII